MSITSENNRLLKIWAERSASRGDGDIAYDGLHCKGEIVYSNDGYWSRKPGDEDRLWNMAQTRILFLTKDLNDEEVWDIRQETGRKNQCRDVRVSMLFYKNMMRFVYGLKHIAEEHRMVPFSEANIEERFVKCFDEAATARINCKKQAGGASISNTTLRQYMDAYSDLLAQQIKLMDANIIVCCGGSSMIKDFVADNCYKDLQKFSDWIYFSPSTRKVVIDSFHLSFLMTQEDFYNQMMEDYSRFCQSAKL